MNQTEAACQTQAAIDAKFATWLATVNTTGGCNPVFTNNNTGAQMLAVVPLPSLLPSLLLVNLQKLVPQVSVLLLLRSSS
ncbi:MAG: hypothetical protein IPL31_09135 [Saprospiraceae bacterium]|nr:hypothetical protein [Saprospiraceae bacterium]